MAGIFNHLIHPYTLISTQGESRYLSPDDVSKIKQFVLLSLAAAVLEAIRSSRSLKSSLIIMGLTAGIVFYLASAIFKTLRGTESSSHERSLAPPLAPTDLELQPLLQEMDAVLERLESDKPSPPLLLLTDKERAEKMKAQERQLEAIERGRRDQAAQLQRLKKKADSQSTGASAPLVRSPEPSKPLSGQRQPISTAPSPSFGSRLSTAVFGEEDFTKRPSWVDDPQFNRSFEKAYFASLWIYMYGGGMDVFVHSVEHHSEDAKLREGTYPITPGAPWESFAHHARKKLQEEWQKKNPLTKTISGWFV